MTLTHTCTLFQKLKQKNTNPQKMRHVYFQNQTLFFASVKLVFYKIFVLLSVWIIHHLTGWICKKHTFLISIKTAVQNNDAQLCDLNDLFIHVYNVSDSVIAISKNSILSFEEMKFKKKVIIFDSLFMFIIMYIT